MRLLLWVLLVTLVTLFASTDAAPSKIANADTMKTSKVESIEPPAVPARVLSPEYIADGKRSLRVHANDDATDDDGGDESYTGEEDEERAILISSISNRLKASLGQLESSIYAVVTKRVYKIAGALAMKLYRQGETPVSFTAKNLGARNSIAVPFYKEWYDTNVAKGVIKALD
ncbi:hypothetical protein KRP22_013109 [Phytophthora ramorum]|nr:RxLR effector protein 24 [Phytophthora ramorum]